MSCFTHDYFEHLNIYLECICMCVCVWLSVVGRTLSFEGCVEVLVQVNMPFLREIVLPAIIELR